MFDVIHTRPRVDDAILSRFAALDVATVHEAMGKRGAMPHEIKPFDHAVKCCGRAVAAAAEKRRAGEAVTMERLQKGGSLFDIYNYQKTFDALGVTEEGV